MHRFIRHVLQYTQEGLVKANDRVERILNREWIEGKEHFVISLGNAYASDWTNVRCVFVLSTGRVGTQTLTMLMALSSQVVSTHEPQPRLIKASFDAFMEGGDTGKNAKWQAVVLAARDEALCSAYRKGKIYVETNNRLTYLAKTLAVSFPASHFIHLHRHPYEVVRSVMRRNHYQGHPWDCALIRPRPGDPRAEEWETMSPLEKNAWYWARVNADACNAFSLLPDSRKMSVRADKLFAGNEEILRKLFAFVGVALPPRRQLEKVLGQRINAQREGVFPQPSEWNDIERRAVWEQVAEVAQSLGYEP